MTSMKIFNHPIWLVGFRPFFFLALIAGSFLPVIWGLAYGGFLGLSQWGLTSFQWHAHEMLFGFGWAVLAGFLLTASKNWLKIRGMHGTTLAVVATLWVLERIIVFLYFSHRDWPFEGVVFFSSLSILAVVSYLILVLIRYRDQDSFRDNFFFVLGLPVFFMAKILLLSPSYYLVGWGLALGVFRLAFAVMFERTITQFMKNSHGIQLFRKAYLDYPIKILVFLSIFSVFFPEVLAATLMFWAGALLLLRFFLWSPGVGFKKFEIGIMYVGYLALAVHFLLESLRVLGLFVGVGTISIHVFTFLCMGVVIPGMLIRISQGHTGRKLLFTFSDRLAISSIFVASFFRLIMTQVLPEFYQTWILLSGLGWMVCFLLIAIRVTPFLFKERIDGKEH